MHDEHYGDARVFRRSHEPALAAGGAAHFVTEFIPFRACKQPFHSPRCYGRSITRFLPPASRRYAMTAVDRRTFLSQAAVGTAAATLATAATATAVKADAKNDT